MCVEFKFWVNKEDRNYVVKLIYVKKLVKVRKKIIRQVFGTPASLCGWFEERNKILNNSDLCDLCV